LAERLLGVEEAVYALCTASDDNELDQWRVEGAVCLGKRILIARPREGTAEDEVPEGADGGEESAESHMIEGKVHSWQQGSEGADGTEIKARFRVQLGDRGDDGEGSEKSEDREPVELDEKELQAGLLAHIELHGPPGGRLPWGWQVQHTKEGELLVAPKSAQVFKHRKEAWKFVLGQPAPKVSSSTDPGLLDVQEGSRRPPHGQLWPTALQRSSWRAECLEAAKRNSPACLAYCAGVLVKNSKRWKQRRARRGSATVKYEDDDDQ